MTQWYAQVGEQRYGPAGEEEVRAWLAQGRIKPTDFVWCEGMTNWAPAGTVFGGPPPIGGIPPLGPMGLAGAGVPPPPGGAGGTTPNTTLMSLAYESMSGRWGIAIGFSLLLPLINLAAQMIPHVGVICVLLVAGAFRLSACIFFLNYNRGGVPEIGMLFAGFKWFGNTLATYLLITLFTFLWLLLLIVPGIIAALSYSQAFYLLADNPELGPMEAIRQSKQLMDGRKWKTLLPGSVVLFAGAGVFADMRNRIPLADSVPIRNIGTVL